MAYVKIFDMVDLAVILTGWEQTLAAVALGGLIAGLAGIGTSVLQSRTARQVSAAEHEHQVRMLTRQLAVERKLSTYLNVLQYLYRCVADEHTYLNDMIRSRSEMAAPIPEDRSELAMLMAQSRLWGSVQMNDALAEWHRLYDHWHLLCREIAPKEGDSDPISSKQHDEMCIAWKALETACLEMESLASAELSPETALQVD